MPNSYAPNPRALSSPIKFLLWAGAITRPLPVGPENQCRLILLQVLQ